MSTTIPIDLLTGPRLAIRGAVVTMNASFRVVRDGVVYIDKGNVVAVKRAALKAPKGFETTPIVATGGLVIPGFIELHNHLSYDALPLWDVPKTFRTRDEWGRIADYDRLVKAPMRVLGKSPTLMPAVVRYVEVKCLLAGVTTSQGIQLASNAGARRFYKGIVRNVEQTNEVALPEAATRIADVDAHSLPDFHARLLKSSCLLLHLSEGVNPAARAHFLALQSPSGDWAITDALSSIHCVALTPEDFGVLSEHGGSMVWSPLSNLLLYGQTTRVKDARAAGVRMGLGSDWSPTGSKNLLGELKVAKLVNEEGGAGFTDRDIVAMVTRDAAAILKWGDVIGSLEAGKRADLLVVSGDASDPYGVILRARETDVRLVVINGVPRCGTPQLMAAFQTIGESTKVGGEARVLNLTHAATDPAVGDLSFGEAHSRLEYALANIGVLAVGETAPHGASLAATAPPAVLPRGPVWTLALDELEETGMELRPRLPHAATGLARTGPSLSSAFASVAPPASLRLDPPTVADDAQFLERIENARNLPAFVKAGLKEVYGG